MRKFVLPIVAVLAGLLAITLNVTPASAQATRTWVSGVGDDVNPCSRTAPCKTFAGAISKTAASGEINCLDPGGFGAVTITKSISIICTGVIAGVLVTAGNGIIVNAGASDKIILEGLDIEGSGTGTNGVRIIGASRVIIRKTTIKNFTQYGVDLEANTNARVFIEDCLITNSGVGGLLVQGAGGVANNAVVDHSILDSNGAASIKIASPGTVFVSWSMLEGSTAAYDISAGGNVTSYGNNVVRGTGTATTTLPTL